MEWWAWLVIAVVAVGILAVIVMMILAVLTWRQANRQIRHVERRIGSPLWTYERTNFQPPTRGTRTPPKRPGRSPSQD